MKPQHFLVRRHVPYDVVQIPVLDAERDSLVILESEFQTRGSNQCVSALNISALLDAGVSEKITCSQVLSLPRVSYREQALIHVTPESVIQASVLSR
jgi:hypothetical protein